MINCLQYSRSNLDVFSPSYTSSLGGQIFLKDIKKEMSCSDPHTNTTLVRMNGIQGKLFHNFQGLLLILRQW